MAEDERLTQFRKVWRETGIPGDDVRLVARSLDMTTEQYALQLHEQSTLLGRSLKDIIVEDVTKQLNEIQDKKLLEQEECEYLKGLLKDSKLSRVTKWRISKLPREQWEEAIQKASVTRGRPVNLEVSLINSKEANEVFLGENGLGFRAMVIFSILCRVRATGSETVTIRDLWSIVHRSRNWTRSKDYGKFVQDVRDAIDILNDHFSTPKPKGNDWVYAIDGDSILTYCNPQLWKDAVSIKHVVDLSGMLGGSSHLDWLHKAYVARWVRISGNDGNSMRPTILLSRMNHDVGACSKRAVEGYLSWLASQGLVGRPAEGFVTGNAINWLTVRREDKC